MPERTSIGQKLWLLASLAAGIAFWAVKDAHLPPLSQMALKGAGVAFLALYAVSAGQRQIAAVMALGALGDVLIERSLQTGAVAFLLGHLLAIWFYLQHRRPRLSHSQRLTVAALGIAIPLVSFLLPADRAAAPGVALYAVGLGGMAASAWASRFSRYRVGVGAVMFAVSDWLIFARLGPLANSLLPGLLIWPLYYFGQFLICTGVVTALQRQRA
ncbi:MAG: hypothetical protein RLZZ427_1745 [Pseudomonadota bacterium]|jgi:uncharacterized membrane protein YhhN